MKGTTMRRRGWWQWRLITSYLGQKESSLGHHVLIVAWAESKYYWYHFGILSGAPRPKADISGKGVKEADLYPCPHLHCCVMLLWLCTAVCQPDTPSQPSIEFTRQLSIVILSLMLVCCSPSICSSMKEADLYPCHHVHCCVMLLWVCGISNGYLW